MDVIVLNHKNKVSLQVQHVDIGSSIDLHFQTKINHLMLFRNFVK